ncbi:MAG: UDP-N-acetylenolpyruvoylglucosamine reductase, partial [Desulfatitalea sp.]|nr:hypothetical protein [Desulfatitalea sp.]NNJ99559.1 UDP-N-acetylenolpyruvoylglucosamine reductase [Desulfatitalea sp.]
VDHQTFSTIERIAPRLPAYFQPDGTVKLSAAWLIDQCGWKGRRVGRAAVHDRHALILVNLGGAAGNEVMDLAGQIQNSIWNRFGIRLEMEPILL